MNGRTVHRMHRSDSIYVGPNCIAPGFSVIRIIGQSEVAASCSALGSAETSTR